MNELEQLLTAARAGDLDAFGRVVRRFQDMAYGYAYAILGDFHLAEDAAQDAFVEAFRSLDRLNELAAFPGWLRRIVQFRCSRVARARGAAPAPLEAAAGVAADIADPAQMAERNEMSAKVLEAIRTLPEREQAVTTLFYINGYTTDDIAAFLEVPAGTVKSRLAASRKRLKQRMLTMVDETLKSHSLPDDFAGIVVRKASSRQDLQEAGELIRYMWQHRPNDFATPAQAEEAGIYVVGKAGRVEGAGQFGESSITIGSTPLTTVRPYEMGAEGQGVPDPVFVKSFQACFKLAAEKGVHLAGVHGTQYDHAFCGFVPCFYYPVATLPCERGRAFQSSATVVEADDEQAEAAQEAWRRDPHTPKMSAYVGGGAPHVIRQDGDVVGYVRVNPDFAPTDRHNMPFGFITDVTVQTRDAALAVLRLGAELSADGGLAKLWLMQSHMTLITQTLLSLGGTYLMRGANTPVALDAEMVAILDLFGLTEELAGEFEARLGASSPRLRDAALSIEAAGQVVGFVVESERLEIVAEKQRVHRMLPHWIVTRMYMGYYSGQDVLAMDPIPWDYGDLPLKHKPATKDKRFDLPEAESALLQTLFPKLWPVAWPDPDVWPWVIGQAHPRYRLGDKEPEERRAKLDALRLPWIGY